MGSADQDMPEMHRADSARTEARRWLEDEGRTSAIELELCIDDDGNLAFIVACRAGGALKTGSYVDMGGANHTCFLLSFLHLMGFPEVTSFGAPGSSAKGPVL